MIHTISVTLSDIVCGQKGRSMHCPIALALKRNLGASKVSASPNVVSWALDGASYHDIRSPASVQTFIHRFDTGEPVYPFTFTLEE